MHDRIIIGTRRYSSWSLRGWLATRIADLAIETIAVPLDGSGRSPAVQAASPSGKVPYLFHQGAEIWESSAIIEYCAEFEPALWPHDRVARAHARSLAAEVHAGFRDLRATMPMNIGRVVSGYGRTPAVLRDIARIEQLWHAALAEHGGQFLFGEHFGAVDTMFAPIVARFMSYEPQLSERSQAYCRAVWSHELMRQWIVDAAAEPADWHVATYDVAT